MAAYSLRPARHEAVQFKEIGGGNTPVFDPPAEWADNAVVRRVIRPVAGGGLVVSTPDGNMGAAPGDWIVRGSRGEIRPMRPDFFAETYEAAEG